MTRKLVLCPNLPEEIGPVFEKVECEIRTVSLLFGGGSEAGKVDVDYPIRETEIRGMLRFWWRATIGAKYPNYQTMREAESVIWGATDMPSSVNVKVNVDETDVQENTEQKIANNNNKNEQWRFSGDYSYILFPWNEDIKDAYGKTENICKKIAKFKLSLDYSDNKMSKNIENEIIKNLKEDEKKNLTKEELKRKTDEKLKYLQLNGDFALKENIEIALKAWINFGGYGARTRRGCGALECDKYSFKTEDEVKDFLKVIPNEKKEWPTLGDVFIGNCNWMELIKIYREFRQQRTPADPREKHPHRSYWPEPDALRRITGKHSNGHDPMNYNPDKVFPRAEFGLPIMFEIRGEGEPGKNNVVPEQGERFSSPVIISMSLPAFVFLNGPRPDKVKIDKRKDIYSVKWQKTSPDNRHRLNLVTESGSALDKFKEHIKDKDFKSLRGTK